MLWMLKKQFLRIMHRANKLVIALLNIPIPVILNGSGSIKLLADNINARGIKNVLVVTDKVLNDLNLLDGLLKILQENGITTVMFDDVEPNPTIENIEAGKRTYNQNKCDGIIAFGGGSPIDCAKIIGARVANPFFSVRMMKGKFRVFRHIPPFFCVPTTAGTGSETTVAAIIKDKKRKKKFAILDMKLVPLAVVLDPDLLVAMPQHITATTGMDALTHAVEAYIGLNGTSYTDECAEYAVKLIFENLEKAYRDGLDLEARSNMSKAAFYAGLAVTRTNLGYVHAIAHHVGGLYGVAHGLANAVILPYVLEFSKNEARDKLAQLAICTGVGTAAESPKVLAQRFIDAVKQMNRNMNIPAQINELRVKDIPFIVKGVIAEAHPDYAVPTILKRKQVVDVVTKLLPTTV